MCVSCHKYATQREGKCLSRGSSYAYGQVPHLTITEFATRVGLSLSPCHRRLRELESNGTIRGYRAAIDPAAVGLGFEVLVS